MGMAFLKYKHHSVLVKYEGDDEVVHLPADVDGLPLREIGPGAFKGNSTVRIVVIPMTINTIGTSAFEWCTNLRCVGVAESEEHSVFPPSLYSVEARAFMHTRIKDITFTAPLVELGTSAFSESSVSTAWFHETSHLKLDDSVFMRSDIEQILMPTVEIDMLPAHTFAYCKKLRRIHAAKINAIGNFCFADCEELEELPARKPLEFIGDYAFSGCKKLPMGGLFRTMRDVINALGDAYLIDEVVKEKCPHHSWLNTDEMEVQAGIIAHKAKEVLNEIRESTVWYPTDFILIKSVGSENYSTDGWDYCSRFYLYSKKAILERFRENWDWNTVREWEIDLRPPARSIFQLTNEETLRMVAYENLPKSLPFSWGDVGCLLNAELGGVLARAGASVAMDFLSHLIDYRLDPRSVEDGYEITNDEAHEVFFSEDSHRTTSERIDYLKYAVLFNRICLYGEIKAAYFHLSSNAEGSGEKNA